MLPRIIFTKQRIFRYYTGFSFFVFIWISKLENDQERLIRHERIHFYQQIELLFVFHWLLYGLFYLVSRLKGKGHYIAYRYNPFELEAYKHDNEPDYLNRRSAFAWSRYLKDYFQTLIKDMRAGIPKEKEITW
jgi:hypothetical protein